MARKPGCTRKTSIRAAPCWWWAAKTSRSAKPPSRIPGSWPIWPRRDRRFTDCDADLRRVTVNGRVGWPRRPRSGGRKLRQGLGRLEAGADFGWPPREKPRQDNPYAPRVMVNALSRAGLSSDLGHSGGFVMRPLLLALAALALRAAKTTPEWASALRPTSTTAAPASAPAQQSHRGADHARTAIARRGASSGRRRAARWPRRGAGSGFGPSRWLRDPSGASFTLAKTACRPLSAAPLLAVRCSWQA